MRGQAPPKASYLAHSPLKALLAKTFAHCLLIIPGLPRTVSAFSVFGAAFRGSWARSATCAVSLVQVLAGFTVAGICTPVTSSGPLPVRPGLPALRLHLAPDGHAPVPADPANALR